MEEKLQGGNSNITCLHVEGGGGEKEVDYFVCVALVHTHDTSPEEEGEAGSRPRS